MKGEIKKILILISFLFILNGANAPFSFSSTIDELKSQINEKNNQIQNIEEEIKRLQEEINKNSALANTLKNQINQLNLQKQKLQKEIFLTQKEIETTSLNIQELSTEINIKEKEIQEKIDLLKETIKKIKETESISILEVVLSKENLSEIFGNINQTEMLQDEVNANLDDLKELKLSLEEDKKEKETQKKNLENYQAKLVDQNKLVEINQKSKNQLLTQTKNKQTNYQKLLSEKIRLKNALEAEIDRLEEQIKIQIDPNSIPKAGSGVLAWPFTDEKMKSCRSYEKELGNVYCITQYFGRTPFATQNPQIYKSGEHKGLDFRAAAGTEVLAADSGIVAGTGDTDITCPNASYGKWIMINHNNGLSTVYGHLSLIKVVPGQYVKRGELIGYSGNTGYSTGPHLHFEVRATRGTQITKRESMVCTGRIYTIPIGSISSYLNPLSYL